MSVAELRVGADIPIEALTALYDSVGWGAYTRDPESLLRAVRGSSYVVGAWYGDELIGLVRALSDGEVICYVQDILIHPDWQRRGIGRALMSDCLDHFAQVRQVVLLTDDEERQHAFYEAMGFKNASALGLNAFVRIKGLGD